MSSRSGSSKNDGSTPSCCLVKLSAKNVIQYVQALALDMGTMGIPGQELLQGEKLTPEHPVRGGMTMAWVPDESEPPIWTKKLRPLQKEDEAWVNAQDGLHATAMTHYTGKCGSLIAYLSRSVEPDIITRMKNCTEAWHLALSTQDPLLFHQLSLKVCTVVNSVRVNQLGRVWEDKTKRPEENIHEFWQTWTEHFDAVEGAGRIVSHHEKVTRMMSALGSVVNYPALFDDCVEAPASENGPVKPWPTWDVLQQRIFQHHDLRDAQSARLGGPKGGRDRNERDHPSVKYSGAYSANIRGDKQGGREDYVHDAFDARDASQYRGGGGGRGRSRERGGRGERERRGGRGGRDSTRRNPRNTKGGDRDFSHTDKGSDKSRGRDVKHSIRQGPSDPQTERNTQSNKKPCHNCDSRKHETIDCPREKVEYWECLKFGHLRKYCTEHIRRFRERKTVSSNMASVYEEQDNGTNGIQDGSESDTGMSMTYRADIHQGNEDVESEDDVDDQSDTDYTDNVVSAFHALQVGEDSEDEGEDAELDRQCINFDRILREARSDTESDSDEDDDVHTSYHALQINLDSSSDSSVTAPVDPQSATAASGAHDCSSLFGTSESDSIESTSDGEELGVATLAETTSHPPSTNSPHPLAYTASLTTLWAEIEVQTSILRRLQSQLRRETVGEGPHYTHSTGNTAAPHKVYDSDGATIQDTSSSEHETEVREPRTSALVQSQESQDDSSEEIPTILRAAHHAHVASLARARRIDTTLLEHQRRAIHPTLLSTMHTATREVEEQAHDAFSESASEEVPDLLRVDALGNVIETIATPKRSKRMSARERNELQEVTYYRSVQESENSTREPKFPRDLRREAKGRMCTSDDETTDDDAPAHHPATQPARLTSTSSLLYPGTGIPDTVADYERWTSTRTQNEIDEEEWRNSPLGSAYDWLRANTEDSGGGHTRTAVVQHETTEDPQREAALEPWRRYVAGATTRLLADQAALPDHEAALQGVHSYTAFMHEGHRGSMEEPLECEHCNGVDYIHTSAAPCSYCRPTHSDDSDDWSNTDNVMIAYSGNASFINESEDDMSDSSVFTVDSRGGGHYYVDLRVTTDPPANLLEAHKENHLEHRSTYGSTHHRTRLQFQVREILHARIRARINAIIPEMQGNSPPPVAPEPTSRKSPRREEYTVLTHSDSHTERQFEQRLSDISDITRAMRAQDNSLLRDVESIRRVRARRETAEIEEPSSSTSYSSSSASNDHTHIHAARKGPAATSEERRHTAHRSSKETGGRLSPSKAAAVRKRQQSGMMAKMHQQLDEVEDCEMEQAQPKHSAHVRGGFRRKAPHTPPSQAHSEPVLNSSSNSTQRQAPTPSDHGYAPHVYSPNDTSEYEGSVAQAQERTESGEPTSTPARRKKDESDSDDDNHVTALMSSVSTSSKKARREARDALEVCLDSGSRLHVENRVHESVAHYATANLNPNLILRGIEGVNMPI
ncbi:hypothetical protein B484DRAFT_465385 [Ochromonadaceae sp. CCMP2298]|nr:hypothetical protein B484DRAFT_465385 [Ochromonadaceae sp. CCMP2298]